MKILTLAVSVLCVLALTAGPAFGHQEDGRCDCKEIPKAHYKKDHGQKDAPPKKGEGSQDTPKKKEGPQDGGDRKGPPKEGGGERKCGKSAATVYDEWIKRKDVNAKDLEQNIKEHFKQHVDGVCHCLCGHNEGGAKKEGGGEGPPPIKKVGGGDAPPAKKEGPPGEGKPKAKKCNCEKPHDGECKDKEKGNNGVGNGEDPQPPGKPPVNDGPGSGKGKPGNKGGDKK